MKTITLLAFFVSFSLFASLPDNDLKFSKSNKKNIGQMTKTELEVVISDFKSVFADEAKERLGKELVIQVDWDEDRVKAYASTDLEDRPLIYLSGGLIRHPLASPLSISFILCHELGHHLGGAPKKLRGHTQLKSWASAEGQADYYAGMKCLPKLAKRVSIPFEKFVDSVCSDEVCQFSVAAGFEATSLFASLKRRWTEPSLKGRDRSETHVTVYKHPNPQCRLDTVIAAAKCPVGIKIPFSDEDPTVGACVRSSGHDESARPRCWFKP